ncbi:hypothetical protein CVU37_04580 [candidate division BRC1 bacterium HGW-BRC1-1]|jgi:hypothetical protein|nr:MAG: hypothetical protein CVU37_04580 [candidate division BRC1 bacterium HGW-BRC1-1]
MKTKPYFSLMAAGAAALLITACGGEKTEPTATTPEAEGNVPTIVLPETTPALSVAPPTRESPEPTSPTATSAPSDETTAPAVNPAPETSAPMAMAPPLDVRAAVTPAPTPVIEENIPPAAALATVRSVLVTIDPLTQPRLTADKEAVMRTNMMHVMRKVEEPGAYSKDDRENASELAGKIAYQFEEARNATNADVTIKHLKRAEELLGPLEETVSHGAESQ